MTEQALDVLMLTLFAVISSIGGHQAPDHYPTVSQMPRIEIAMRICGSDCRVHAAYHSESGVMIDDTLDLQRDPFGQSVLVHELVHFLQDANGTFAAMAPCKRQYEREREAYWIQDQYLQRIGHGGMTGVHYSNWLWPRCFDE